MGFGSSSLFFLKRAVVYGGVAQTVMPWVVQRLVQARRNYPNGVYNGQVQTVAETPIFSRQADRLFNEEQRRELIDFLAENPLAGDRIPGTGGVRKLRFAASGHGKRGGARVIYYFLDNTVPIYALLVYAKAAQTDMTQEEKRAVSTLATALRTAWKERQNDQFRQ